MGLSGLKYSINNKMITLAATPPPAVHTLVVYVLFLKQKTQFRMQTNTVSLSPCKTEIKQNSDN